MRIVFVKEEKENSIELKPLNILSGPNNIGKSEMLEYLYFGFSGKLKSQFIADGNIVNRNDLFLLYISEADSLDNEKLLGAKSMIRQNMDITFNSLPEKSVSMLNSQVQQLQDLMIQEILPSLTLNDNLTVDISFNIMDILGKFSSVVYNEMSLMSLSYSQKRLSYFKMCLKLLKDINQKSVLFIDGYDNGLSKYEADKLLIYIKEEIKNTSITLILTSTNYYNDYTNLFCGENNISNNILLFDQALQKLADIQGDKITELKDLYNTCEIESLFSKHNIYTNAIECYMSNKELHENYKNILNV